MELWKRDDLNVVRHDIAQPVVADAFLHLEEKLGRRGEGGELVSVLCWRVGSGSSLGLGDDWRRKGGCPAEFTLELTLEEVGLEEDQEVSSVCCPGCEGLPSPVEDAKLISAQKWRSGLEVWKGQNQNVRVVNGRGPRVHDP